MMPITVPNNPTNVLEEAIVASQNPDYLGQAGDALNRWRANNRVVYGM